jgi:hypothetical protein
VISKLQWSHGRLLNSVANFTKLEKNNKYFWVFEFFKQEQKEISNKAKYFWIFLNIKPKLEGKSNQYYKIKKQTKRNNRNIFGLFVFWKVEMKQEQQRKRKKAKHGYTKFRHNMMYK